MSKHTGFKQFKRYQECYRTTEERIHDYQEVIIPPEEEIILQQTTRCMDCGVPFCHAVGCPLGNLIPEWNQLIFEGRWREAYERLALTHPLPEITGKVCPAPCEASCTLGINRGAVNIRLIESAIIEKAFQNGWMIPQPPELETGKKIAIIGSGPAGLAAARKLRRMGHGVTIFEKALHAGGFLRYGIPDFKLEKWIIDRRLKQMVAEGIKIKTGIEVGADLSLNVLQRKYDAVLIATGARAPRDLDIPGRTLNNVHFATDYLTGSNQTISGECQTPPIDAKDQTVLILGGGDTGSDCVGTAIRQGAKKIYQFEIMPRPEIWNNPYNPQWPEIPRSILKVTSSHKEGCERQWGILTELFNGDQSIQSATFSRVNWFKDPKTGKQSFQKVAGSTFTLDIDLVILATGFIHTEHNRLIRDLTLNNRGNIAVNRYQTSMKGVFSAGDAITGASLVVHALNSGLGAAKAINDYLT